MPPDTTATPDAVTLRLAHLVRDGGKDTNAYLDSLEVETSVASTQTVIRWHRIGHDATLGKPDTQKLIDKLVLLLIDFSCTRKERDDAILALSKTGSTQAFAALQEKARRLFTTSTTTGEIGELMLYFLAEHLLKYPQVLCKFRLKTNPSVHVHGADGVHASVDPVTGHLRLHWGEAKLYQKLGAAVEDCFSSLKELILEPPDAKKTKRRDIELLRDFSELNDQSFEMALRSYLDPDEALSKEVRYCGLALIGFDLRKAYTKRVYVDRDFQRKTNDLVQGLIGATLGEDVKEYIAIDRRTLESIAAKAEGKATKVINLVKAIEKKAEEESDDPFLVAMAERARAVQEDFENRQSTTEKALEDLLAEISKNEQRKKAQAEKGLDGLSYFVLCKLTDDGIPNAEKVSGKIREAFAANPGWKDGDAAMRELRKAVTIAVFSEEDDLDKVTATVDSLFTLLEKAFRK